MSVAELIENVLRAILAAFYRDRAEDFFRDRHALTRAIARYGVECHSRGWEFSTLSIQTELLALLNQIRKQKADIKYLPVYLEGAVDRHIRVRAEELSAHAKLGRNIVKRTVSGIQPAAVREATEVETLAALYKSMRRVKAKRKSALKPIVKEAQQSLL